MVTRGWQIQIGLGDATDVRALPVQARRVRLLRELLADYAYFRRQHDRREALRLALATTALSLRPLVGPE